jgi:hypothetical protein
LFCKKFVSDFFIGFFEKILSLKNFYCEQKNKGYQISTQPLKAPVGAILGPQNDLKNIKKGLFLGF